MAWFEWYPDRLNAEVQALEARGVECEIDEPLREQGVLRLKLLIPPSSPLLGDTWHDPLVLVAVFPDYYPHFRPEIFAPEIGELPRHFDAREKLLCLLRPGTERWNEGWLLVDYLDAQLAKALGQAQVADPADVRKNVDELAESWTRYMPYEWGAPVLCDMSALSGRKVSASEVASGLLDVRLRRELDAERRVVVSAVKERSIEEISSVAETVLPANEVTARGLWYRVGEKPPLEIGDKVFEWLMAKLAAVGHNPRNFDQFIPVSVEEGRAQLIDVIGISFPDEIGPGEFSWSWVFLIRLRLRGSKVRPKQKGKNAPSPQRIRAFLAPAMSISVEDYAVRVPKMRPLRDKCVAVVGLGTLGAPAVLELARAGIGEIRILDFDTVDAATTVRWPLGLQAAGLHKTKALETFMHENWPHVRVTKCRMRIGNIRATHEGDLHDEQSEVARLRDFFDGADVVLNAAAEDGVTHLLSRILPSMNIPHVVVTGRQGGWGGAIIRIIPGDTEGCWMCYRHALEDGTDDSITAPPEDKSGTTQPQGCQDHTFTGTGFDMSPLASMAVRYAVGVLCRGTEDGYGSIEDDVAILAMVDESGKPILPAWTGYRLEVHEKCEYCAQHRRIDGGRSKPRLAVGPEPQDDLVDVGNVRPRRLPQAQRNGRRDDH